MPDLRTVLEPERAERASAVRTGSYLLVVLTAGAYLPSPLYPDYQRVFEISDLAMTLIYATFALVSAPVLLLFGSASDALGARAVLRAGTLSAAAGSLCFAFAADATWLVAGRAAQGLALGAATAAATTLISDNARDSSRSRGTALASTAFLLGTAAGPVAAGVLAQYLWAPRFTPYLLHLLLLWFGWRRVSALRARAETARAPRPRRPRIPRGVRWSFAAAAMTGFLAWAVVGLFLAVVPALLDRAAQVDTATTGFVLGAVLVCSAAAQPLVVRVGVRSAQLAGLAGLFTSLCLLASTGGGSIPITLCAAVVAGAGHGLAYGGAAAAVEDVAPRAERGAVVGALYLAFYLGAGCPAIAVGLVTLGSPLEVAMSWVTAAAGALVPVAAAAVAFVRVPGGGADRDAASRGRPCARGRRGLLRGNRCPGGPRGGARAPRWRRSRRPRPAGDRSRPS